jgi:hypothetical protein
MFGDWQAFALRPATPWIYGALMLVFLALIVISITIAAVAAARNLLAPASHWPSDAMMTDLTCDLLVLLVPAVALACLYAWVYFVERRMTERRVLAPATRPPQFARVCRAIWMILYLTLFAAVLSALLVIIHLVTHQQAAHAAMWPQWLATPVSFPGIAVFGIWSLVFGLNLLVRRFLIDYLGDVTAYVAAHSANKFYQIRTGIQKLAHDVARAVYAMKDADGATLLYDRIVFVGHSLGSVIAYDTLNAMLLDEETHAPGVPVIRERTPQLITFGSPLDKTAFLFREQQPRYSQVREALAACVQPLIERYAWRDRLQWWNLYAGSDWISDPLHFYDETPARTPGAHRVDNAPDPYSTIPLMAHTMYWRSPALGQRLLNAV